MVAPGGTVTGVMFVSPLTHFTHWLRADGKWDIPKGHTKTHTTRCLRGINSNFESIITKNSWECVGSPEPCPASVMAWTAG